MAGGMDLGGGGGGGKKPLDSAINLVPFIDLMAVTIAFLVMSAVWTQVGALQVSQSGQAASQDQAQPTEQLKPVAILLREASMTISFGGQPFDPIQITRDEKQKMDVTLLAARLKEVKSQEPTQTALTVTAEDSVRYDDLVRVIDTCTGNGFGAIAVSPASG